ncbi:hypothetical protein, partial [Rhizobium sp. Pop5]
MDGAIGYKGRVYYFPHKSYIEFLCAEYVSRVRFTYDVAEKFFANVNPEIVSFLEEGPASTREKLREGLSSVKGEIGSSILRFISDGTYYSSNKDHLNSKNVSVYELYISYFSLAESCAKTKEISSFLINSLRNSRTVTKVAACLAMIGDHIGNYKDPDLVQKTVRLLTDGAGLNNLSSSGLGETIGIINEKNIFRAMVAYSLRLKGRELFR